MKFGCIAKVLINYLITPGCASILYCLGFAHSQLAWAAYVFLIPLLFNLNNISFIQSLLRGFLFAFFATIGLTFWIFETLRIHSEAT